MQSSKSNTKVSRVKVHLLSEGPIRGLGVCLTCQPMHFLFVGGVCFFGKPESLQTLTAK